MHLNPDWIACDQLFANTVVHEYVHARQFGTIGGLLFTSAGRVMSRIQAFAQNAGGWLGGDPWDYDDAGFNSHFYGNDWAEKMARVLAEKVFPTPP
jgi:hypothetical protein